MWNCQTGDERTLYEQEKRMLGTAALYILDVIETNFDPHCKQSLKTIPQFGGLNPHEQVSALWEVWAALTDPQVPFPGFTALREATIWTLHGTVKTGIIDECDNLSELSDETHWRRLALAAGDEILAQAGGSRVDEFDDEDEPFYPEAEDDSEVNRWENLLEVIENSILWDDDFALEYDPALEKGARGRKWLKAKGQAAMIKWGDIQREYFHTNVEKEALPGYDTALVNLRNALAFVSPGAWSHS